MATSLVSKSGLTGVVRTVLKGPKLTSPERRVEAMVTDMHKQLWPEKPLPKLRSTHYTTPSKIRKSRHTHGIKVAPPLPAVKKTCPDPVKAISDASITALDPTGVRTRLFSTANPEAAHVGDILLVRLRSGDPFAGVCINIRRRGVDTAILLRGQLTRIGVEMWYKVYSPLVEGIEVVQRAAKRARRARLTYMRTVKHDRGDVSNLVRVYLRTFVLADETSPTPPSPATTARPSTPNPQASTFPEFSAPPNEQDQGQEQVQSSFRQPSSAPANPLASDTTGKRRRRVSESEDSSEDTNTQGTAGRAHHPNPKRRRTSDGTMRLENDASLQRSPSPQNFTNGSRSGKVANGDSRQTNGSFANGASVPNGSALPATFYGHDREEITRILIQSLTDLGYNGAAGALSKESGFQLEGPTVASFRSAVLNGDWAEAEELLFGTNYYDHGGGIDLSAGTYGKSWAKSARGSSLRHTEGLALAEGANRDHMLFEMKRQKYLELLESRDLGKALMVLRQELAPLHPDTQRLHFLSSLMMISSAEDMKTAAGWDGSNGRSRSQLLSELSKSVSPRVMLPEHRLSTLLDQVKAGWISKCLYHNTPQSPSLFMDHMCEREDFPLEPVLELKAHKDEVWYLKFSHDGSKLASTSKDKTIVIYDTVTFKVLHTLEDHDAGVTHVAWSPDDTKIITCCTSQECSARIWDVRTGRCLVCISEFTYPCTTAAWALDGKTVVVGSQDTKYGLAVWDTDGNMVHQWNEENLRVNDLAISPDGERLVVLLQSRILVYDFLSFDKMYEYTMDGVKFTSVAISRDSQHMLLSMNENRIELFELDTGEFIRKYEGHVQTQFIIRSSFGGANENFVVSGSEGTNPFYILYKNVPELIRVDSKIYIWRANGTLIAPLEGHHEGCVNTVAWHPTDPRIFASAGDDHRVRIWKPASSTASLAHSNGFMRL
ncbi:WD40 repeat-like protein [Polyplosphaeria fusca]|uniref:WD40 repeat-like protein n=1 Tax=Polyplosphaeria fusca TaxID=682080 RepID=A0A9P4UUZ4_9PLEO|nr:WD40 repeat-like protein [Polyplosphaeria fusca]